MHKVAFISREALIVPNAAEIQLLPNVREAIASMVEQEWLLVEVSHPLLPDQAAIQSYIAQTVQLLELLPQLNRSLFCPDEEGEELWQVNGVEGGFRMPLYASRPSSFWEFEDLRGTYRKPGGGMMEVYCYWGKPTQMMLVGSEEDWEWATCCGIEFVCDFNWRSMQLKAS